MAKKNKDAESVLQGLYDDYGLLAQEQDPKKVAAIMHRLADSVESGDVSLLGFTFGFTVHVEAGFPRAVIDLDFQENKVIDARRATAPEKEA